MKLWPLPLLLAVAMGCASSGRTGGNVTRAQLALAHDLAAKQSWPALMLAVQRMHEQGKRSAETLTLRAAAFRGHASPAEAEVDLRAALELDDDHAPAHAALAVLLDRQGKADEADRHHRRAIDLDRKNAEYLNNHGFSLLVRGRWKDAIAVLRRATDLAPLAPRYRNNLGFAYARAGDFPRAAQQFALGGSPAEARNNLGFAYEVAGNLPQAFDAYVEALRLDSALDRARANLASVAGRLDRELPVGLPAAPEERRTP